jgi:hypothetical protein
VDSSDSYDLSGPELLELGYEQQSTQVLTANKIKIKKLVGDAETTYQLINQIQQHNQKKE